MSEKQIISPKSLWRDSPSWGSRFWVLAVVLLWCAIPLSPNTVDSDFWGHVQYGQDSLDYGIAQTSTYNFTAEGYRWINHENLCEITFAVLTKHVGPASVLVLKCFFGVLVIGLIIHSAAKKVVSTPIIAGVAVLTAINLSFYWGMRPQIFSFTFFAIVIAICERFVTVDALRELSTRAFAALVAVFAIVFVLWTNSHGGFVAGICVFNMLVLCRAIEAYRGGQKQVIGRCVTLIALCSLATLFNPYGIHLHLWLIESLRIPRPEVTEWHAPDLFARGAAKIWCILLLSLAGFAGAKSNRDWSKIAVFSLVLLQALMHQRHLPFVAILFGFWIPQNLQILSTRLKLTPPEELTPSARAGETPWFVIGPLALLCVLLGYQVGSRLCAIEVTLDRYPVEALQFMADNDIENTIVVTGEWAQYVLAVAGARTPEDEGCRVAFDGRFRTCYPQSVVDMHFDFFRGDAPAHLRYRSPESPPADPKRVLEFCGPNLVLMKTTEEFASGIMRRSDQWSLLYKDRTAELWGRSEVYDQPESKDYLAASLRVDSTSVDATSPVSRKKQRSVLWPAAPIRTKAETAFVSKSGGDTRND